MPRRLVRPETMSPAPAAQHFNDPGIQVETAVRLTPRVWRVTADNPGLMTGPGTNSYLLLGAQAVACIDPGPDDAAHRAALLAAIAASSRPLTHILLTHTHRDHSPGSGALAAATGARILGMPPLAEDPSQDRATVIDDVLQDGQVWDALDWPLHVVHTPGHVENHCCFHDPQEGWVLTGDHLIQGSTVVIIPPHGRLGDYLRSLDRLLPLRPAALLPGHGTVIAEAETLIRWTLAHRLQREAKVIACLTSTPEPLEQLVGRVYDDVPTHLHPVARFSLWAHLVKLQEDGRAVDRDGLWSAVQIG